MARRLRIGTSLLLMLLAAPASADEEFEKLWSATLMGDFTFMSDEVANDDVGSFFDQYDFTPNKSSSVPFELGVRDASFDMLGSGDTPVLQFRFESPTSNLGVSGSQIDQPFLNQRGDLYGRFDGIQFDLDYRRMRTEELRLFPNSFPGAGPQFTDLTSPDQRFQHDRTGFFSELRVRPFDFALREDEDEISDPKGHAFELALRGGYDGRDGNRQYRFIVDPTNSWLALTQPLDQNVSKVGGGTFSAPGGLFTMALDVDYKRFRQESNAILQSQLGGLAPSNSRTIDFIPDSDLITGTIKLSSRLGERALLTGGFQIAQLEQVDEFTPNQIAAGLQDNSVLFYSANLGATVALFDGVSADASVKYDRRDNEIQRDSTLYNPVNQLTPFYSAWSRVDARLEAVYRRGSRALAAVGGRFEGVDRNIDNTLPIPGNLFIPTQNLGVNDETRMYSVYGRTRLRPLKGLDVRGELGYRFAPETGYVVDLDNYIYGNLRASYALPIERSVVLSAFARGGSGNNDDFNVYGPTSAVNRDFDRYGVIWGLSATTVVRERASLFASFFWSRDAQDYDIVTSTIQRYFPGAEFATAGSVGYRNTQINFSVGTRAQITDRTDGSIAYSFTRARATYSPDVPSNEVALVAATSIVDSDIQGFDFEVGHWIRDGLRVMAHYRLQLYSDGAPLPTGNGSVVSPFDLSMTQHSVMLSVTLTSGLFGASN